MKKQTLAKFALVGMITLSTVSIAAGTLAWFISEGSRTRRQHIDGEIGLRSYFYAGDGLSAETAYEITTPTHMFNLNQLQNLGLFPEHRYFQIGHYDESTHEYKVITRYDGDEPEWGSELDMSGVQLSPIGNESTPFVGTFTGNGIPVSNAVVKGNPEDIGFFGYVGHQGSISGLVLKNINIHSIGYGNNNPTYDLFHPEVDDLYFNSTEVFEKYTKVKFYGYDLEHTQRDGGTLLTHENGLPTPVYSNINHNGDGNMFVFDKPVEGQADETNYVYNGYFDIKTPTDYLNDPTVSEEVKAEIRASTAKNFTYKLLCSTPLVGDETLIDITGDGEPDTLPMINLTKLINAGTDEGEFNASGVNSRIKTRVYVTATVEYQNFTYSRVIQSYELDFHSNKHQLGSGYSVAMYCDYMMPSTSEHPSTNYHHGRNIGFLVGHLDGSIRHCYVYGNENESTEHGSSLFFNDLNTNNKIYTESDMGLIGECGEGVFNKIDPDIGVLQGGDTGVINFSRIYEGIRGNFVKNEVTKGGHITSPEANYISYDSKINQSTDASLFNSYKEYLRYVTVSGNKHYISGVKYNVGTGSPIDPGDDPNTWHNHTITEGNLDSENGKGINSVDFLWNSLIQDELPDNDRGLGVFKIATTYIGENPNPDSFDIYKNLGKSAIINGKPYTKVYFSTAEYDHVKNNSSKAWENASNPSKPVRGSTLPSYSDLGSFDYNFERDYNYCFELDLSQVKYTGGYNMMSNTDSEWLSNYLQSKLIDKDGFPVEPGSKRFGFMFRSNTSEELNSLSSYYPVGYPKSSSKKEYDGKYYPTNSIVFKIDNENGANVSVVAGGKDVSIYKHHTNVSSANDVNHLYTMRVQPEVSESGKDAHRYFKFDVKIPLTQESHDSDRYGVTGTEAVVNDNNMEDNDNLYAHIFKLKEPGEYVIGACNENETANIYFLAVQGQKDGDIGSDVTSELGNEIDDVDFLTAAPTYTDYHADTLQLAGFQFRGAFNNQYGQFKVYLHNNDLALDFEKTDEPTFITQLRIVCSKALPSYYVKQTHYDRQNFPYRT